MQTTDDIQVADGSPSIYGDQAECLQQVMDDVAARIRAIDADAKAAGGEGLYEHLSMRVKSDASMREKCRRKDLPETPESALVEIHDAIGLRVVCRFVDDVYAIVERLRAEPGLEIANEKDYIRHAKPNGYRSYHLILRVEEPWADVRGKTPGHYYVEVQLRTIAQDMWAALEHQLKYKQDIGGAVTDERLIVAELKRCADELASCDVSMQTIRTLIRGA